MNCGRSVVEALLVVITLQLMWSPPTAFSQDQPVIAPLLSNLKVPVAMAFAPDGRILFNEKNAGNIRVIQDNALVAEPFATIGSLKVGSEQGLLGVAISPDFSSDGHVYVYFTTDDVKGYTHGKIRRFTAVGNVGTEPVDILDVKAPVPQSTLHNGGYIKFGPDGKLYAEVGEFHDDPVSQNLSSYAGKILRMNADGSVPPDNPFPGSLVYSYGLRNAFGMDFRPGSGALMETEAGTDADEINIISAGGNYGWPSCRGICRNPQYVDPILVLGPPAVTPTGIAFASDAVAYFGEWNTGDLERLVFLADGTVSANTIYTSPEQEGIISVERGAGGNIYFSTPSSIYLLLSPERPTSSTSTTSFSTTASPTISSTTSTATVSLTTSFFSTTSTSSIQAPENSSLGTTFFAIVSVVVLAAVAFFIPRRRQLP